METYYCFLLSGRGPFKSQCYDVKTQKSMTGSHRRSKMPLSIGHTLAASARHQNTNPPIYWTTDSTSSVTNTPSVSSVMDWHLGVSPADVSNNVKVLSCAGHSPLCVIFLFSSLLFLWCSLSTVRAGARKGEERRFWGFPLQTSRHPPPKFGHMSLHAPSLQLQVSTCLRGPLWFRQLRKYNKLKITLQEQMYIWFTTNCMRRLFFS